MEVYDKESKKEMVRKVLKWHKTKSLKLAFEICQDLYDAMTEEEKEEYATEK